MPQNEKRLAWVLRIDDKPDHPLPESPGKFFLVQFPGIFCVHELGGDPETPNPHWHVACVYSTPESKQTITNRLKKLLPNHTKCERAVSAWKGYGTPDDKLLQYLCKGPNKETQPDIVFNGTLESPEQLHEAFWIQMKQYKDKNSEMPLHERVYLSVERFENFDQQLDAVSDEVMRQTKGKINDNIAWPHIQAVMYRLDPLQTGAKFRERIRRMLDRNRTF